MRFSLASCWGDLAVTTADFGLGFGFRGGLALEIRRINASLQPSRLAPALRESRQT